MITPIDGQVGFVYIFYMGDDRPINVGVHVSHCCVLHGCKYGHEECPVVKKTARQEFVCETCSEDGITDLRTLDQVMHGMIQTCDHCGHVIRPKPLTQGLTLAQVFEQEKKKP